MLRCVLPAGRAGRARPAAPGTKVIASVTLLQHVTAREGQQMYGSGVAVAVVGGGGYKILCEWIWICCKTSLRRERQTWGGGGHCRVLKGCLC